MKEFSFEMPLIQTPLKENGPVIYQSPDFTKVSVLAETGLMNGLVSRMEAGFENLTERELHRKNLPREFFPSSVEVTLPAARRLVEERSVTIRFHFLWWNLAEASPRVAYVPALALKVIADGTGSIEQRVREEIENALRRTGCFGDLQRLMQLSRMAAPTVTRKPVQFTLLTAAEKQREADAEAERRASVIGDFVDHFEASKRFPCHGREPALRLAAGSLTAGQPRGLLLTGPSGVGKTAFVHELARRKHNLGLGELSFWETTGARIVAGMAGFGEWQERCVRLAKQASKLRAVVFLGNLGELCQTGRSEHQNQSIAEALIEPIRKGRLLVIVESTAEELALLEKDFPQVVQIFDPIHLLPPIGEDLEGILRTTEKGISPPATLQSLHETVISLHRRFGAYAASPGREVRFLQLLRESLENKNPGAAEALAFFQQQSGMPDFLLDTDRPFAAEEALSWFSQQVRGQPEALHKVVDIITTLRAGLQREGKPIANLLFAGPTGVGKTQLARSLADYLFGDENRLLRIDMSEYQHPAAVRRLAGSAGETSGLLTSRVREQPFSIILFDEFEKAHPDFFDLLLQICGEGRLTDPSGRVASFASSVIIMTSNLGAEKAARGRAGFGHNSSKSDAIDTSVFIDAVREHLRPEIFNRLDHIIPFVPLPPSVISEIADHELRAIKHRYGMLDRDLGLKFTPAIVERLADEGFDIRYGARPLKRAVAHTVLVPMADTINTLKSPRKGDLNLSLDEKGKLHCEPPPTPGEDGNRAQPARQTVNTMLALRRNAQALKNCELYRQLSNEQFFITREKEHKTGEERARLSKIQDLQGRVETFVGDVFGLEDEILNEFLINHTLPSNSLELVNESKGILYDLLAQLEVFDLSHPHEAVLALYGRNVSVLEQIFRLQAESLRHLFPDSETRVRALLLNPDFKKDGSPDLDDLSPDSEQTHDRWERRSKKALIKMDFENFETWESEFKTRLLTMNTFFGLALEVKQPFAFPFLRNTVGFVGHLDKKVKTHVEMEVTAGGFAQHSPKESGRFSKSHYPFSKGKSWERRTRYALDEDAGFLRLIDPLWKKEMGKADFNQTAMNRGETLARILRSLRQHSLRTLLR